MVDPVHALQRFLHRIRVAHVCAHQLHGWRKIVRAILDGPVHLRAEVVQHAHTMACGQQLIGQMRADEAGTAGDEDALSHDCSVQVGQHCAQRLMMMSRVRRGASTACASQATVRRRALDEGSKDGVCVQARARRASPQVYPRRRILHSTQGPAATRACGPITQALTRTPICPRQRLSRFPVPSPFRSWWPEPPASLARIWWIDC